MLRVCATRVLCHVTALFCVLPYFFNRDRLFANAQCATFDFPDLAPGSDKLTVKRGADIHFLINTASCPNTIQNSDFTVTIAKKRNDGIDQDICKLSHIQGMCSVSFTTACQCPDDKGRYYVLKVAGTDDETRFIWKTTTEGQKIHFKEKIIQIELQYPVSITKLSLRPSDDSSKEQVSFTPGNSVDIVCTFEPGKPMVEPVLRKPGTVLEVDGTKTGERRHRIPSVQCEDSGTVWCKGAGASQNKSATLIVKCPPVITKKSVSADATDWEFYGKSYSPITNCSIARHATENAPSYDCLREVHVKDSKGVPTDFVLTLKRGSSWDAPQEGENYTLTLANDLGPTNFPFSIPGPDQTKDDPHPGDNEDPEDDEVATDANTDTDTDRSSAGVMSAAVDLSVVVIAISCAALFWSSR